MTPASATRVGLVYGWAAVAPDGRIDPERVSADWAFVDESLWSAEREAGWRVIRVQISPAGKGGGS